VIARFGAPAEVLTDQGTEFRGEFEELLRQCFVDHRVASAGHPQTDGAAERAVQTLKRAFRKYGEVAKDLGAWERHLPWILLGYRCSKQKATGQSPYEMLYGVAPSLVPSMKERMDLEEQRLAFESAADRAKAAEYVLLRAQELQRRCAAAGGNLKIAQHRDTLRYARTRGGAYVPRVHQFLPGDYVYVRRQGMLQDALLPRSKETVLRVVEVRANGRVVVQGRCGAEETLHVQQLAPCHLPDVDPVVDKRLYKPPADWPCQICGMSDDASTMLLCDNCNTGWHKECMGLVKMPKASDVFICRYCTAEGVTAEDVRRNAEVADRAAALHRPAPGEQGPPALTPGELKVARAARKLSGSTVVRMQWSEKTLKMEAMEGTVEYLGPEAWPKLLLIKWLDGSEQQASPREVREMGVRVRAQGAAARRRAARG
jgi:hypothetical protein